jgi:hypothetical protein
VKDERTGWVEADVTINGKALTFAEAISLRVAVSSFRMTLHADGRSMMNELGEIGYGYDRALEAIEALLTRGARLV